MKAMNLADYIIIKANELDSPVSNLMLQKVMYFLNVMHLLNDNKSLVTDEKFERWDYGPVLKNVYNEYSIYGSSKINSPSDHKKAILDENNDIEIKSFKLNKDDIEKSNKSFVDENINKLLKFKDPFILVDESHKETQWKKLNANENYNDEDSVSFYTKTENQFWND